jgi:translation initiation factor SUI1
LDDAESDAAMMLEDEAREEEELRRKEDDWIYGECWHQPYSNCGCRVNSMLALLAQQKKREEKGSNKARLVKAWTKARDEYQIFVVPPQGNTIALDVNANWTVEKLMSKLKKRLPLPSRCYRLMCGSQELDVNGDVKRTLRDSQVNKESTVRILLRLLGGSTKKPSYGTLMMGNEFALEAEDQLCGDAEAKVHLRTQARGRKHITTVSGLPNIGFDDHDDQLQLVKTVKKTFKCSGVIKDGVMQFSGSLRAEIRKLLISLKVCDKESIQLH